MRSSARTYPNCDGFILYHPECELSSQRVLYNQEAYRILSLNGLPSGANAAHSSPDFPSICDKWKRLFDQKVGQNIDPSPGNGGPYFINLYQSSRRRYILRGCVLSHCLSPTGRQKNCSLFILERVSGDASHLGLSFRKWNLSRREQEIVRLLLEDRSNKEIADTLHLSVHTVKAYLKLLTRRLGVSSRAGVLAVLLRGESHSHEAGPVLPGEDGRGMGGVEMGSFNNLPMPPANVAGLSMSDTARSPRRPCAPRRSPTR